MPARQTPVQPEPAAEGGNSRDAALLRRVAAGDRAAFESLYGEYFGRLHRFLSRVTQRREVVEEAINDAFWVVWQKAADFRGGSQVSTWVIGIAYRCALKALRRNASALTIPVPWPDEAGHEPIAEEERADWIGRGLAQLPVEQRSTIELAYYLGHSCEEIAQIMDCPVGTVKARMFHARVKLRNLLPALGGSVYEDRR
jgi:RNA polymerase sigma-70 factor, ECF subfamily